jgi:hypothetical protein
MATFSHRQSLFLDNSKIFNLTLSDILTVILLNFIINSNILNYPKGADL